MELLFNCSFLEKVGVTMPGVTCYREHLWVWPQRWERSRGLFLPLHASQVSPVFLEAGFLWISLFSLENCSPTPLLPLPRPLLSRRRLEHQRPWGGPGFVGG